MTGHGQPEGGTNVGPANISERVLREYFFPPFAAAVKRANVQAVMPSYNEIDGVPSHANAWLINQVLRKEMGFKGGVVSDYWGVDDLQRLHGVEPDLMHAAVRALKSGVDFDTPDGNAFSLLPKALAAGLVTQAEIDQAVRRMLQLKFLSGVFEDSLCGREVRRDDYGQRGSARAGGGSCSQVRCAAEERWHAAAAGSVTEDAGGHRTECRHRADGRVLQRSDSRHQHPGWHSHQAG